MTETPLSLVESAVNGLTSSVQGLKDELVLAEKQRGNKIRALQNLMFVVVPAIVLLIVLAATNFVVIRKTSAISDTIAGCLRPNTPCSDANRDATRALLDQIRQTQFVIAVCQRQNPVDSDPDGTGIVKCVQDYYPGFHLPQKAPK